MLRIVSLTCFIPLMVAAAAWDTSPLQNINTTGFTTGPIVVDDLFAKRQELLNAFKTEFELSEKAAKKVVQRLQKALLEDKKAFHPIDIFISDSITDQIELPSYRVSINHLGKTPEVIYRQNERILTTKETEAVLEIEAKARKERRELHKQARQKNLETIVKTISKDITSEIEIKLYEAVAKGVPYVSLQLTSKTIQKLLQKVDESLSAVDIHLSFQASGINEQSCSGATGEKAQWCNRLDAYLDVTGVKTKQDDVSYSWNGRGIGIYYADVECPAVAEVTDPNGIFDGYLPKDTNRYHILYLNDNPANDGNLIDQDCIDDNTFASCSYNKSVHTKIITGILSTVAPLANLYCKGAMFSHFHPQYTNFTIYNDDNITVYEDVLPTDGEMQQIYVESYSLNRYASSSYDDLSRDYYPMDKIFDNHAYDYNVPIFIAAGNLNSRQDNDVVSPAKGLNVVSVGNYYIDANSNLIINPSSSINNPLFDGSLPKNYQKPEISAPGSNFYSRYQDSDLSFYDYYENNGTSFATPFAAAVVADYMSRITVFQSLFLPSGALYKASAIAMARDHVQVENIYDAVEIRNRVGEGGIDLNSTFYHSSYVPHTRHDLFNTLHDGKQCAIFAPEDNASNYLGGSMHLRFVVAWFSRISDANIADNPNRFSMEVLDSNNNVIGFYRPDGTYTTIANEPYQGYQIINFTLKNADPSLYKARVCKIHEDTLNHASLGFASTYIPFEYTPPQPPAPGVMEAINTYLLFD